VSSSTIVITLLLVLVVALLIAMIATCVQRCCWKKLRNRVSQSAICEVGSVYWLALPGGSWIGLLVFGCTVALQLGTFISYLSFIMVETGGTEATDGDEVVVDTDVVPLWDYIPAVVVLFFYLMRDIVMSLRIIIRGGGTKSSRNVFTGCTMLMMTLVALLTTLVYFYNVRPSRTESLTSAVNAIVINDIDKKVFEMLRYVCPQWVALQRAQYLQSWVQAGQQIIEAETRTPPGDKCYWFGVWIPIVAIILYVLETRYIVGYLEYSLVFVFFFFAVFFCKICTPNAIAGPCVSSQPIVAAAPSVSPIPTWEATDEIVEELVEDTCIPDDKRSVGESDDFSVNSRLLDRSIVV
jgi:hypothetical protein